MKEQSHIDAMRAAIRGDRERSCARQDGVAPADPEPEAAAEQPQDKPRPGFLSSLFKRG